MNPAPDQSFNQRLQGQGFQDQQLVQREIENAMQQLTQAQAEVCNAILNLTVLAWRSTAETLNIVQSQLEQNTRSNQYQYRRQA